MASARAMIERRRAARIPARIPVKLSSHDPQGTQHNTQAEAIAVSRCGALVRAPFSPELGSRVDVVNSVSQESREFRVVRVTDATESGYFHLGLEILYPGQRFWNVRFPDEETHA
jgi:PilZ domain-containing protein